MAPNVDSFVAAFVELFSNQGWTISGFRRRLPPLELRIGFIVDPIDHFRREMVVDRVAVGKKHVLVTSALIAMPDTHPVIHILVDRAIGMPWPVALKNLVARCDANP